MWRPALEPHGQDSPDRSGCQNGRRKGGMSMRFQAPFTCRFQRLPSPYSESSPPQRRDQMPYGGNKMSGIGQEGVRFAIEEMTNIWMVCFNLA